VDDVDDDAYADIDPVYLEEGQKKVFRPLSEETRENKSANISD